MAETPKTPLNEFQLKELLRFGCTDKVETVIKEFSLPYAVKYDDETGIGTLVSKLSRGETFLSKFITETESCIAMKRDAAKMAACDYEVLVTGETGTGKEIISESMIGNREGPIKALNCAGFPEELIESELFGHVKGAFTDAKVDKVGLMQAAKDGICFLDEVGELPLTVQAKLLRVIQSKKLRKVGSNEEVDINCKFVCATNRNVKTMVEQGSFRKDLYARLSTLEIHIEPLKVRPNDVEPILLSMPGGKKLIEAYSISEIKKRDLSLNVRSLQQLVIRYNVLGAI